MKRLFVFILILVFALSITVVSFASVSQEAVVEEYIGFWQGKTSNSDVIFAIAYSGEYSMYTANYISLGIKTHNIFKYEYSLTYDKEENIFYLTNNANSVSYKMKLEDGKIKLMPMDGEPIYFEKIN